MENLELLKKIIAEGKIVSEDDFLQLLMPLVSPATQIISHPPSLPPKNTQNVSHFGGQPYFEEGESWPLNTSGKPLEFIFQVFNSEEVSLPTEIKLLQFFYDSESSNTDKHESDWCIKTYPSLHQERAIPLKMPSQDIDSEETPPYCEISFEHKESFPHYSSIFEDSSLLHSKHKEILKEFCDKNQLRSQLGGHPTWVQKDETPKNNNEEPMRLLFQLDSDENHGRMWGDMGLIYVFYNPNRLHDFKLVTQGH